MEITREFLEKKKEELEAGKQQLVNNINANAGALQLIDILIQELSKDDKPAQ